MHRLTVMTLDVWNTERLEVRRAPLEALLGRSPDVLGVQELRPEVARLIERVPPDHHSVADPLAGWMSERNLSNDYLAFSAMLMAGIDGVRNKIEPPDPVDKDIYDLPPEELHNLPSVPRSLEESLAGLQADHDFLLEGGVFTEDLIETWISYKMENEVAAVGLRPHPLEFQLYYDI
jgi:hypothetical protein